MCAGVVVCVALSMAFQKAASGGRKASKTYALLPSVSCLACGWGWGKKKCRVHDDVDLPLSKYHDLLTQQFIHNNKCCVAVTHEQRRSVFFPPRASSPAQKRGTRPSSPPSLGKIGSSEAQPLSHESGGAYVLASLPTHTQGK